MARPSRPNTPDKATAKLRTFFVTTRAAGGAAILQSDRMAMLFVDVLRCYIRAGKFTIHDFVIMGNHVHLLITVGEDISIEKAMQLIKGRFSFRAKSELGVNGEIWQRGFSDVRIRDEASFQAHQLYIYNNPVKSGIVNQPESYEHGSLYLRMQKAQGLKPEPKGGLYRHD
jgi:putative transposase